MYKLFLIKLLFRELFVPTCQHNMRADAIALSTYILKTKNPVLESQLECSISQLMEGNGCLHAVAVSAFETF